jgi:hypothetical protein
MYGTALVYCFYSLSAREQVVFLYQLFMVVQPFTL